MLKTLTLVLAAGIVLAGCSGTKPVKMTAPVYPTYLLGAGDTLRVIVYGEDKLSGEYTVGDNGAVTLPLVGSVKAEGLTVDQFDDSVAKSYKAGGYLNAPAVAAQVITYRPFFILGEVNKPGQYPFIPGMTVRQAIATANGFTYRAKQSQVALTHWRETKEVTYKLDSAVTVAPGDTIRVRERHF